MRLLYLLVFLPLFSFSQKDHFIVQDLIISGHKKTKEKIILRELDLLPGQKVMIEEINTRLKENEKRILSTGLFTNVKTNITDWDTDTGIANVEIELQENWYIYPAPIFELADRNFNVWWNEQGKSLDRVNYGVRLSHINFSGQRDKLKLVAQFGYTKKFEADYYFPYLNDAQTIGLRGNIYFAENKEIGYRTIGNKTEFWQEEDERVMLRRFRVSALGYYRPDLYHRHIVSLSYHHNTVDDLVIQELNPSYFLNGKNNLRFALLQYDYKYDKRIFTLYPEGGYRLGANVKKEGLGIFGEYDNLRLTLFAEKYFSINDNVIISTLAKAKTNLNRSTVSFANNTGLGYGSNYVRGYELYVQDGTDSFLSKNSVQWKFLDKLINNGRYMPMDQFKLMSLKLYLTANLDMGYVNEPTYRDSNLQNNRLIVGYGPGLNMVLFNLYLLKVEYSFNHLGESAIYIHNRVSF